MATGVRGALMLVLAVLSQVALADDVPSCGQREPGDTRPRIGLALGGGGARGVAHVSVLREIESNGVRVDCIAGTSMGSLVGAMYASGMSVDEIEKLVTSLDWKRLFDDKLEREERSFRRKTDDRLTLERIGVGVGGGKVRIATGVLAGQRIQLLFERLTLPVSAIHDFDDLPIPFRAVATDLNTGEAVVIGEGSLALAMRASMSLPGIFNPVEMDGRVLLDGGLVNQVPIDVVRTMGADVVIAVDVGTPLVKLDRDASVLAVLNQMTGMMTVGNTRAQLATLGPRDVLIVPALGDRVTTGDFAKGELALEIGREAAAAARPGLAVLAAHESPATPADSPLPAPPARAAPVIEFVRLDNTSGYADEFVLARLDIPVGEPLDADRLDEQLQSIYGIETFGLVTYEVVEDAGATGIVVHARSTAHGPNYIQAGLLLGSDFEGGFTADLRAGLLFAPISPYGAEARVAAQLGSEPGLGTEIYYPFDPLNRNVFYGNVAYRNPDILVYDDDGNNTAAYDVSEFGVIAAYVRELGNYGAIQFGLERAIGDADLQTGDTALPDFEYDRGEAHAKITLDRLDNLYFARDGYYAELGYVVSRDALGADDEFEQLDFDALAATGFGRHGFQGVVRYHSTIDGTAPVQSLYRLGGRGKLVGFRRNELTGQHYAVLGGGYLYELADVLGRSAFLGGTIEYGNAWQTRREIDLDDGIWNASIYFGFDSWLGPLLFGYGAREGGDGAVFLEIGLPY